MSLGTVHLGDTGLEPTVLGFGCADLFREPSRTGRLAFLAAAHDAGIRYFDAAPMYGLGLVERELGRFARGRRDQLVLATKFGISPTRFARALALAQGPLQRLSAARRGDGDPRSGAAGRLLYRSGGYGAGAARTSLERSLRALGTDHVDLFWLHDPEPGEAVSDELRSYLESARAAGLIRAWGVAGEAAPAHRDVPVVQVRWDPFSPPATGRDQPTIRFGAVGRPLRRILGHVRQDPERLGRWSTAVGADCSRPETIADLLLRDALATDPSSPLLFSSSRAAHIASAAAAAIAKPGSEAVAAFRRLLADDLPAAEGPR